MHSMQLVLAQQAVAVAVAMRQQGLLHHPSQIQLPL